MAESLPSSPVPIPTAPPQTLYDSTTVGLATFLGSPLAGCAVMALNYKRLGKSSAALLAVLVGAAVTALLVALGFLLPSGSWTTGLGAGLLFGMISAAKGLQGPMLEAHRQAGGKVGSRWVGAAAGGVALLIVGGLIVIYVLITPVVSGTRLTIGSNDEIYYGGKATENDARALGDVLKNDGIFQDKGATVQLLKGAEGTVLSFIVNDGVWDAPNMIVVFEGVAREVAPSVGGLPVKLRLLDGVGDVKKEWAVR